MEAVALQWYHRKWLKENVGHDLILASEAFRARWLVTEEQASMLIIEWMWEAGD